MAMLGVEAYQAFRPEAAVGGAAPMVTQRAMVPARSGRLFPDVGRHSASARPATALRPALKRLLDVAGAFGLAVALLPLLLVVAALVKADGGPALFAHERVGRGGRRFGCLKFRSMVVDSAERLEALLAADPEARAEWEATRKLKRDPRVTAIGRFLRASSLDELPQLINVLRGEMSLVGPRPVQAAELATHYGPAAAAQYASVRPGITGLWQVSGRSDTSYDTRVAMDLRYVANPTLLGDLRILLKTPLAVLGRRGAY
ncbi:MAG: Undecaprenyl-phosphate galactosephosphotransferase [uncultured Acetobacteraceae bacterium]|uniref:Undecaprenyl-phosphate galactosephosphotransferase n=1 Tax=uncultured Acetobacteraceae bacterium TaxID=169975 RepID=A0A6J4J2R5_9PROT|nr:MAG: Undecaprenyl-phosphate galactosephosphotransferase [uncultured Acetobacteraceae bacterium]